jgi:hypothetical protein
VRCIDHVLLVICWSAALVHCTQGWVSIDFAQDIILECRIGSGSFGQVSRARIPRYFAVYQRQASRVDPEMKAH